MSFLKKLFGTDTPEVSEATLIEAGACPNCWGTQAYGDQFVAFVKDQTKSNIDGDKQGQKAFVQQFVETNITGIRLKRDGNSRRCPACKMQYKHVSDKAN